MKDLIKETVGKIKERKIRPQPRWKYLLKKYGVWFAFGVMVVMGAISFSVAFDLLSQLDWDLHRFLNRSAIIYSLSLLPYFWLILIGAFLMLAFFDLRKTETGYRYSWLKISLVSIGGIFALGFVFFLIGLGGQFNNVLVKDIPYYGKHMIMTKQSQWMQPSRGFLAGSLNTISNNKLEVTDLDGNKWNIILDEKTLIRPAVNMRQGERIKIIGIRKDVNNFQAIEIRPWMGQGMMNGLVKGKGGGMSSSSDKGMMRSN